MNQILLKQPRCQFCQKDINDVSIAEHEKQCGLNYNGIQQRMQSNTKICEFCDLDFPKEQYSQHLNICDAKLQLQRLADLQILPSNQQYQNVDSKNINILEQYFKIIEQYETILQQGDELVKISNLSIEPFSQIFQIKVCKTCSSAFELEKDIVIMKCCSLPYHHHCFAQIILKTNICECGKQIIN